jgi:ATP-binding cassette subfamily B protein
MVPLELRGEKNVRARAMDLLDKVGLSHRLHHYPAQLSGGEQQRVSIARALMKEAPVLILDDALSAVDARTEKAILSQLGQYLQNKTSLFITHRIFNLIDFHKIIVLENGRIAEQGNHMELLAKEGIYAEMYAHQMQENNEE